MANVHDLRLRTNTQDYAFHDAHEVIGQAEVGGQRKDRLRHCKMDPRECLSGSLTLDSVLFSAVRAFSRYSDRYADSSVTTWCHSYEC